MEEERRRRRRRGRRRGRSEGHPSDRPPEEQREESQPEGADESEKPEDAPSRSRFRFGRRRDREEEQEETEEGAEHRRKDREERPTAGAPTGVSPLSFWRRGRARTYREQPMPKQTVGRTLRRIGGMHFPPWLPVLFIMVLVSGILVVLFVAQGAGGAPRVGQDHWHATYQTFICGQRQPNFDTPEFRRDNEGVHTHGDGIIHMHPFLPASSGAGARLVKWFGYGGGKLTQTELQVPGDDKTYKNGDTCPDGSTATLQVFANGQKLEDWSRYIAQDGDQVRIAFGPEQEAPVELDDRTVIGEAEAGRTVELEVTGAEGDAAFVPDSIQLKPGETVKLLVDNTGSISHSVRVEGADGVYETSDDFVSEPEIIQPGEEGFLIVRLDEEGEFEFQDPSSPAATGTIVVTAETAAETPEPDASEPVDVTFDVVMGDNFFDPRELEVEAEQSFRINLINEGELVHNLRITGPDRKYDTGDDLVSTPSPLPGGESGELVGQIDKPGVYDFRDDFHPTEAVGTITVK